MDPVIHLTYATSTGTSQDVATRLSYKLRERGYRTQIRPINEAELPWNESHNKHENTQFESSVHIFFISTAGQGHEPIAMAKVWKELCKKKAKIYNTCYYTIYGLGDSSYEKFNYPALKLHRRLSQLDNTINFAGNSAADDQHYLGIEATFPSYSQHVLECLVTKTPLQPPDRPLSANEMIPPTLKFLDSNVPSGSEIIVEYPGSTACVVSNDRITSIDHFQDVRHIKVKTDEYNWKPGDIMEIDVENCSHDVEVFMKAMEWEDRRVEISGDPTLPPVVTIKDLLTRFYTPFALLKNSGAFLELYSKLNPLEKLKELAREPNEAQAYIGKPGRNIAEVLHDFPLSISPIWLGDLLPKLKPRQYSIAGHQNGVVDLCIALVEYKTILVEPRRGLASRYFASAAAGTRMSYRRVPSILNFPTHDIPVILVGPGTGIAPFRAYLNERTLLPAHADFTLYFGCRFLKKDCLYAEDIERWRIRGNVYIAASREQQKKHYVQHIMKENGEEVWRTLEAGGHVLICGNSHLMPKEISEMVQLIVCIHGKLDMLSAQSYMARLQSSGRWQIECYA